MIGVVLTTLFVLALSYSAPLKYCIQVAADKDMEALKVSFQRVKDYPEARIEKRENLYLLRVGAEERKENLYLILRGIKKYFPDAFIKKCEIDESYIAYPERPQKVEKPEVKTSQEGLKPEQETQRQVLEFTGNGETKELLISIKNELSILRKELKEVKNSSGKDNDENPAYFEKFLYSVGIFTGGLFFFTWILLILLYKKVGASNVENTNLLNDMFNLIKVLNLLSKGQIIKMENGKLLVYDRKNEKWREVD